MADSMVMNYLQTFGKQIGIEASNDDQLAKKIINTYSLYHSYPGPAELGILHELIRQHEQRLTLVPADNASLLGCPVVVDQSLPAGKVVMRKPRRR